jgi:hypothetical protein
MAYSPCRPKPVGRDSTQLGELQKVLVISGYLAEEKKADERTTQDALPHANAKMILSKYTESSLESQLAAQDVGASSVTRIEMPANSTSCSSERCFSWGAKLIVDLRPSGKGKRERPQPCQARTTRSAIPISRPLSTQPVLSWA